MDDGKSPLQRRSAYLPSKNPNDSALFISFLLRRQRGFQHLTVREVASRLSAKSPNAYAQYESGKISPSINKLVELLKAINPDFEPILKAG